MPICCPSAPASLFAITVARASGSKWSIRIIVTSRRRPTSLTSKPISRSVFAGALIGRAGYNRIVIRACLEGWLRPLMGQTLFLEYEDVLSRDRLFERSQNVFVLKEQGL